MMEFIKKNWLHLFIVVVPFAVIPFYWNILPDQVPSHWNISGEIDSYSSKEFGILMIPVLNVIFFVMFILLPKVDPRGENYKLFGKSYDALRLSISGILLLLFFVVLMVSLGVVLDVGRIVMYGTLILFLIVGNHMNNIKKNYFLGIRTPWTFASEIVWKRTHRFASKIWVSLTVIMIFGGFFMDMETAAYFYFTYVGIIVVVPSIASYFFYKELKSEGKDLN